MAKNVNVWARYDRTALEHMTQYWFEQAQDRAREIEGAVKEIGQLEVALEKAQLSAKDWRECAENLCATRWRERALAAEARAERAERALFESHTTLGISDWIKNLRTNNE